jgi:hypothetical protein
LNLNPVSPPGQSANLTRIGAQSVVGDEARQSRDTAENSEQSEGSAHRAGGNVYRPKSDKEVTANTRVELMQLESTAQVTILKSET